MNSNRLLEKEVLNKMKRIFALLLALVLIAGLVACTGQAEEPNVEEAPPEATPIETETPNEDGLADETDTPEEASSTVSDETDAPTATDSTTSTPQPVSTGDMDISGTWVLQRAELDNGTAWTHRGGIEIEITSDAVRYVEQDEHGTLTTEGILHRTDENTFSFSNKTVSFNGVADHAKPSNSEFRFDSATDLLRHTGMFYANEGTNRVFLFFARV